MGAYGIAGDPAGMYRLAALLRAEAERQLLDGKRLSHTVDGMVYAGPAAERFRGAIAWSQLQRGGLTERLNALADRLARGAAEVEQQQQDEQRRLEHAGTPR